MIQHIPVVCATISTTEVGSLLRHRSPCTHLPPATSHNPHPDPYHGHSRYRPHYYPRRPFRHCPCGPRPSCSPGLPSLPSSVSRRRADNCTVSEAVNEHPTLKRASTVHKMAYLYLYGLNLGLELTEEPACQLRKDSLVRPVTPDTKRGISALRRSAHPGWHVPGPLDVLPEEERTDVNEANCRDHHPSATDQVQESRKQVAPVRLDEVIHLQSAQVRMRGNYLQRATN